MPRMKRFLTIAALLTAAAAALPAADVFELGFLPMSPAVLAQGGAATATARGWDSFFANPGGFSRDGGNLTILQTGAWMYARPDRASQGYWGMTRMVTRPVPLSSRPSALPIPRPFGTEPPARMA